MYLGADQRSVSLTELNGAWQEAKLKPEHLRAAGMESKFQMAECSRCPFLSGRSFTGPTLRSLSGKISPDVCPEEASVTRRAQLPHVKHLVLRVMVCVSVFIGLIWNNKLDLCWRRCLRVVTQAALHESLRQKGSV